MEQTPGTAPAASAGSDPDGASRLRRLLASAEHLRERWHLHQDGPIRSGEAGIVLLVRGPRGEAAALKVQPPGPEVDAAVLGLGQWDGEGVVRVLASDAERGALLLERLDPDRSLEGVTDDDEATHVVGALLARLHSVRPPDGLPFLGTVVQQMLDRAQEARTALSTEDRRRFDRWVGQVGEVATESIDRFLHWDMHFGNVLRADREPWLAIDPEPLIGDAGFDLWPVLDSGWSSDPTRTDAARIVRRRFDILTHMLQLDRDRAIAWTAARLLQNTLWDIEDGEPTIAFSATVLDDALRNRPAS